MEHYGIIMNDQQNLMRMCRGCGELFPTSLQLWNHQQGSEQCKASVYGQATISVDPAMRVQVRSVSGIENTRRGRRMIGSPYDRSVSRNDDRRVPLLPRPWTSEDQGIYGQLLADMVESTIVTTLHWRKIHPPARIFGLMQMTAPDCPDEIRRAIFRACVSPAMDDVDTPPRPVAVAEEPNFPTTIPASEPEIPSMIPQENMILEPSSGYGIVDGVTDQVGDWISSVRAEMEKGIP